MKVLVTGAAGHVGRHVIPALLAAKHEVRIADLNAEAIREAFKDAPLEVMQLDFENAEQPAFDTIVKGVNAVVHMAALGVVDSTIPREKIFAVNVEATRKLAAACKNLAGFKRFVFISSSALFHNPTKIPVEENDPPSPGNAYGESKLAAEKIIKESGLPFVILRPVVVYGLGFEPAFAPIVNAVQKQKMPIIGDGSARFPVVHADDLANAIVLSLEKEKAVGETFNISGEALTQKQWLDAVADELGVPAPKRRIPVWLAELMALFFELKKSVFGGNPAISRDSVKRLVSDRAFSTVKAEMLLGWKPKVNYRDGLNEIIASIIAKK